MSGTWKRAQGTLLVLASFMLPACGAEPSTRPPTEPPPRPQPAPIAPPQAQPPAADPQAVQTLVAGIRQAKQTISGFTGRVDTFEDGPKGKISETLSIAYKKPSTLKIEVVKSTGGNQGTRLLWTGGKECKVKPSFMPFAVSIAMADDRLLSKNGWEIRETEVNSILQVLLDPQTRLTPLGDQVVGGKSLAMLDVRSPATPRGGSHEVIGIDRSQNLPGVRMIYRNEKLIYRLTIQQLTMRTPSASELKL